MPSASPSASLLHQKRLLADRFRVRGYPGQFIEAFLRVPREAFVPSVLAQHAYEDAPLPIEHGQRISQPSTLMTMLILLQPGPGQKVLEVGAGSGYLSAWLAEIGCRVIGVEIIPELAVATSGRMEELGYDVKSRATYRRLAASTWRGDHVALREGRVTIYAGDGSGGWESEAPYDRIILSGGIGEVPRHLLGELNDKGRIVAPVGIGEARMVLLEKGPFDRVDPEQGRGAQGEPLKGVQEDVKESEYGNFLFSPITGKYGVKEEVWEIG